MASPAPQRPESCGSVMRCTAANGSFGQDMTFPVGSPMVQALEATPLTTCQTDLFPVCMTWLLFCGRVRTTCSLSGTEIFCFNVTQQIRLNFYAMQQGSSGADCTATLQLQFSWLADDSLRLAVFCIAVLSGNWLAFTYSRHFEQSSERPVPLDTDDLPGYMGWQLAGAA